MGIEEIITARRYPWQNCTSTFSTEAFAVNAWITSLIVIIALPMIVLTLEPLTKPAQKTLSEDKRFSIPSRMDRPTITAGFLPLNAVRIADTVNGTLRDHAPFLSKIHWRLARAKSPALERHT
jgi:hypothetical protein